MHTTDTTIIVPRAIPKVGGPYRLDFFADVNGSGGFDGLGSVVSNDHAWRIDPLEDFPKGAFPPVEGLVQVEFLHNTTFTNIDHWPSGTLNKTKDTEMPVRISVRGAQDHAGKLMEMRVSDKSSGHVVAFYRVAAIPGASFDKIVPGMVENGVEYDVTVYIDANANGQYDNPATNAGDRGYKLGRTSDAAGLLVEFDPTQLPEANVDVGVR
jgi:hypothetical protein